jgi:hypothetical protein
VRGRRWIGSGARWCAAGFGLGIGCYAGYACTTWLRYGHVQEPANREDVDALLDRFMPTYEVVERHHVRVRAPAEITLAAACEMDFQKSPLVQAIFTSRELVLGSTADSTIRPKGLIALTKSFGWGVLAETTGREIVMGAVAQPWKATVVFRALPPEAFADFHEPGYVKIAWTLRADPVSEQESIFRTETRAVATDASARSRFRRYWALMSPGIIVIRHAMLGSLRADAERRAREARSLSQTVAL